MDKFVKHQNIVHNLKSSIISTCWLRSLNSEYNDVELSNENVNIIGRSKLTKIKDILCSKSQVTLKVDSKAFTVNIKANGINPCGINGFLLDSGKSVTAYHDDVLEILYGKYSYRLEFLPPPEKEQSKNIENSPKMTNNVEKIEGSWSYIDCNKLVVFNPSEIKSSEKIAGFDLDWTIIKTKSGNVFPKNPSDWEIMLPQIPEKLEKLNRQGFKICFFTNQAGISHGQIILKDFQSRIEAILKKLQLPIQVFISTTDGIYRKPLTGMWNHLINELNDNVKISKADSFYVGDAAGRPSTNLHPKIKRDHSAVDRLFAMNIEIPFFTPDEYFLDKKQADWTRPGFNPKEITDLPLLEPIDTKIPSEKCEIILMIGLPGSGKSNFVINILKPVGYDIVNADTLGSVQKCLNICENNVRSQKRCVIDNTNVDKGTRKKFITIAHKFAVPIRCFVMNTSVSQMKHNLTFRSLTNTKHTKVNDMVFNSLKKKFEMPSMNEGFESIVKVNIVLKFQNIEEEKLYKMFLIGK